MALKDLANVVLTTSGPALTQVGFGTLLCAAYHTHFTGPTDLVRVYTSTDAMVSDGFNTYDPAFIMVQRAFQQNPRPTMVKLGRCQLPWSQVVKFTPGTVANNTVYAFTASYKGVDYLVSYTSDGTALASEIVTGLAAAFTALSAAISGHATATGASNTFCQISTTTAGDMIYYKDWTDNLQFLNATTNPGIATDLATLRNNDGDWYGLAVDMQSEAILAAADGWAETQTVLMGCDTHDDGAYDNTVTTDIGAVLKAASAGRCIGGFCKKDTSQYMGVAMLAERFPHDPGSAGAGGTFHGKTLVGITAYALSDTQKANLRNKNYVVYTVTAGRNHTLDGKVFGGEFADAVRGLDWFTARTQERIATLILNNDKVPYTDRGISLVGGEIKNQMLDGENVELFVPGSSVLSLPTRASVNPTDRANRKLTGITGSVTLAGAIHLVDPINITVGT